MVQPRDQLPHRDLFPPREHGWLPERPFLDIPQEGRFTAQPMHSRWLVGARQLKKQVHELTRLKSVESALKDCAGLKVKEFALAVLLENGKLKTYTSTSLTRLQGRIFTSDFKRDFHRSVQLAARGLLSQVGGSVPPLTNGHVQDIVRTILLAISTMRSNASRPVARARRPAGEAGASSSRSPTTRTMMTRPPAGSGNGPAPRSIKSAAVTLTMQRCPSGRLSAWSLGMRPPSSSSTFTVSWTCSNHRAR